MARRRSGLFSLILPREPRGKGPIGRKPWTFSRLWIACLPLSIAGVAGSILMSGGDPEKRPFVIFGIGVTFGVIGLLSLFVGLIQAGNIERARRRARQAARRGEGPSA
jgi:hypothetical protein